MNPLSAQPVPTTSEKLAGVEREIAKIERLCKTDKAAFDAREEERADRLLVLYAQQASLADQDEIERLGVPS